MGEITIYRRQDPINDQFWLVIQLGLCWKTARQGMENKEKGGGGGGERD